MNSPAQQFADVQLPAVVDGMVSINIPIPWQLWVVFLSKATAQESSVEDFASLVLGAWESNLRKKDESETAIEAVRRSGANFARCSNCKEFILVQRHIRAGDQCRDCTAEAYAADEELPVQ